MWRGFFENAEKQSGAPETIKGFLLAVRDCCVEKGNSSNVPEWVGDELARLASLDLGVINTAQLKQRIKLLIANLKSLDVDDRRRAAEALGQMGQKRKRQCPP